MSRPLSYMGSKGDPKSPIVVDYRRPTADDILNYEIGTQWYVPTKLESQKHDIHAPSEELYVLVDTYGYRATWKRVKLHTGPHGSKLGKYVSVLDVPERGILRFSPLAVQVEIQVVGGGGGSGGILTSEGAICFSGAGAGGGYASGIFDIDQIGYEQPYSVGRGGFGGAGGSNSAGSDGEPSMFGDFMVAYGGQGGTGGNFEPCVIKGGRAEGGDIVIHGQDVTYDLHVTKDNNDFMVKAANIRAGSSIMGQAGSLSVTAGIMSANGMRGSGYGAGASSAMSVNNKAPVDGGDGTHGVIIITQYLG